ncbi:MAG: hypothetical protein ACTSU9_11760 [Promethearchaeota archaeon]
MTIFETNCPPVAPGCGQLNPQWINLQLLLEIAEIIKPLVETMLPAKRSGYAPEVYVLFRACVELSQCSPTITAEWLNKECKENEHPFQSFETKVFSNEKQRRYFPDQPALCKYTKQLTKLDKTEEFWNAVLFAHFLLLNKLGFIKGSLKLIADIHNDPCKKDKEDPYCYGQKTGKTVNKTLSFSIIAGKLHQVIANFKLKKGCNRLPFFTTVMDRLMNHGFKVTYALLDREFYRKYILKAFRSWKVTVVMPGRKCNQTQNFINDYLLGKGGRHGKGSMPLFYIRGKGYQLAHFDLLVCARYKHDLRHIKKDLANKKITLAQAVKRVFPLMIMRAGKKGISKLYGNEGYIRYLYRQRWLIEIAFREMNRLGISTHLHSRDSRLGVFGAKSLVYNIWQVQCYIAGQEDPDSGPLELNEFLGKTISHRHYSYLPRLGVTC